VNAATLDALQQHLRAPLVTRSHGAYDDARRVWNGMIDRRPLLIAQPETTAEVVTAVAFAQEHGLPLAVKGGGHGVAGRAVCDDGLVVDLSRMQAAQVDPVARTASVQCGATLRALDAAAQAHGLATTAGIYRETGVVGLALGGGVGLLMRRYGLTCDNLLAAEVVTADGQVLEASEHERPDLFWGLRGGGGNFGVVTRMDFRLHPLSHVTAGRITYDFADAAAVGQVYREVLADAPDELQAYLSYGTSEGGGKMVSVVLCHSGSREAGEAVLARFRRVAPPVAEQVGWMPYLQIQQHWDDAFPFGILTFWKSSFLATISEDALRVCQEAIARQPLPGCSVDVEPMGGAVARIAPDATAFADRDAASTLLITSGWHDPRESEARIAWVRETYTAIQPHARASAYVNYLDQGDEDRTEAVYGGNYQRLVEVKRHYDPENVFCHNANIRP
jgi:FAD/FMN-containing dehydrogenase